MELISILRVVHILTAILMAWPAYALVAVNQRGRLGPVLAKNPIRWTNSEQRQLRLSAHA